MLDKLSVIIANLVDFFYDHIFQIHYNCFSLYISEEIKESDMPQCDFEDLSYLPKFPLPEQSESEPGKIVIIYAYFVTRVLILCLTFSQWLTSLYESFLLLFPWYL